MTARKIIWGALGAVVLLFIVSGWWLVRESDRKRLERRTASAPPRGDYRRMGCDAYHCTIVCHAT